MLLPRNAPYAFSTRQEPPWVRAAGDYLRLRHAYDRLCAEEPENDIGRTLIGMDLARARQALEQMEDG